MTCRACASTDLLCDCNQIYALGLTPMPAREGADAHPDPSCIGPTHLPNRHEPRRTTWAFLRPSGLTLSVNPISKQEVMQ